MRTPPDVVLVVARSSLAACTGLDPVPPADEAVVREGV